MAMRLNFGLSKFRVGVLSWLVCFGACFYLAMTSHQNTTEINLFRSTLACILVLACFGLNASDRTPFVTIGKIPQMVRGLHMVYVCLLIVIVCSNYDVARYIVSLFEKHPTEEQLVK